MNDNMSPENWFWFTGLIMSSPFIALDVIYPGSFIMNPWLFVGAISIIIGLYFKITSIMQKQKKTSKGRKD